MRVASIDIGTNTALLLIGEQGVSVPMVGVCERARITRLGQGVDRTRRLAPEAVQRTLDALQEYASLLHEHDVAALDVAGTSAMRDAGGGEEFCQRAKAILGVTPRVLAGDEEARLTFLGGVSGLTLSEQVVLFDVGGGSTEVVFADCSGPTPVLTFRRSIDIGSVRLTERHVRQDPPAIEELQAARSFVIAELDKLPTPPSKAELIGVAGTVTSIAALCRNVVPYDSSKIHGIRLTNDEISDWATRLAELPLAERARMDALDPKRADVIPLGSLIVDCVVRWCGARSMVVSDRGLRWGLALELLERLRTGER